MYLPRITVMSSGSQEIFVWLTKCTRWKFNICKQCCCPPGKSLSSRTNLQVLVLEDQFTSTCPSTSSPCPCPQTTSPCPRTLSPSQHHCMQHFQPVKPESALQKVIHRQQPIHTVLRPHWTTRVIIASSGVGTPQKEQSLHKSLK